MRNFLMAVVMFWVSLLSPVLTKANAATIGNFQKSCIAKNWQTGQMHYVSEVNVYGYAYEPVMAYTSSQPDGGWLIQWNFDRIQNFGLSFGEIIFLFYHECAHAQYATSDEGIADCAGLAAMNADGHLTQQIYDAVKMRYAEMGRPFPSGQC